jgi:hypothetical protein
MWVPYRTVVNTGRQLIMSTLIDLFEKRRDEQVADGELIRGGL